MNGIFAFALYDEEKDDFLIARDPIGVIPLYIGHDKDGKVYCASELKALEGYCDEYEPFLPGHYYLGSEGKMVKWYKRDWESYDNVKDNSASVQDVHDALEAAVKRQLMCDVPYGVLLSGGLDSSVISAIAKKYAAHRVETGSTQDAWWPQLHSFAVGLKGAPDLAKAKEVADHIGTVHHEINYTIQEGLDAVRDVIYFIETYDVTTVRASTPMYLLARVIKSMGIKWYSRVKVLTRYLVAICIFIKHLMQRLFMRKRYVNCQNSICMTAYVPTRVYQPGVSKVVCLFLIKNSLTWLCA